MGLEPKTSYSREVFGFLGKKNGSLPSSKVTWLAGKCPCSIGNTSTQSGSIFQPAMLVYQSVPFKYLDLRLFDADGKVENMIPNSGDLMVMNPMVQSVKNHRLNKSKSITIFHLHDYGRKGSLPSLPAVMPWTFCDVWGGPNVPHSQWNKHAAWSLHIIWNQGFNLGPYQL